MDVKLHHEDGYGWRPSIIGPGLDYTGEYRLTMDEAYAHAKQALGVFNLLDLAS